MLSFACGMMLLFFFPFHNVKVNESLPFSISLSWKGSGPDAQDNGSENQQSSLVFPKGNPIPSIKALTFCRAGTFSVDVLYDDASGLQTPAKISTYTVSQFPTFFFFWLYYFFGCAVTHLSVSRLVLSKLQMVKGQKLK